MKKSLRKKGFKKRGFSIYLNKTRIKQGLQCQKSLYLQIYKPEWAKPLNRWIIFDQGQKVHHEAYKKFLGHVLITASNSKQAQAKTKQAIKDQAPFVCEAFFSNNELGVRVDVLQIQKNYWNIIEVKFSSVVKKDHVWDVAVQKYILEKMNYKIQKCFVMYVNKDCVYPHLENLFIQEDVTENVDYLQKSVSELEDRLKNTLSQNQIPQVPIGPYCHKPYPCRFISHCWKNLPSPSVFDIPGIGDIAWDFYNEGQVKLSQIPQTALSNRQKIYQSVHLEKSFYIDKKKIKKEIELWNWPLYYLDFETISSPIPKFDRSKPFQQIPFQFSLFKQDKKIEPRQKIFTHYKEKNTKIQKSSPVDFFNQVQSLLVEKEHYLHTDESDPRYKLVERLISSIGQTGSIVAYYKNFESDRLKELADLFPQFKDHLLDIESRLVDPLPLLQEYVCFREFGSSWSMKNLAPVLLGEKWNYSKLKVQDGLMAQWAFNKMLGMDEEDSEKKEIKENLIKYCRQDVMCLALIVNWLYGITD